MAQALRPYPQYSNISQFNAHNGWSTYNSLQTAITKNFSNGLQLNVNYVWSKLLGNGAESGLTQGFQAANPSSVYFPTKALSVDDIPHVVTVTFVYALPFGNGRGLLNRKGVVNAVVGGWTLGGNLRYEGGRPLSIYYSNNPYGGVLFDSGYYPDRVPGVSAYGNTNNGNTVVNASQFVLRSGFSSPGPGSLGNEGRVDSVLRGWANYNEDLSLYKDFGLVGERLKWRIGGNSHNIFNRHQWCDPDTNLSDSQFGTTSAQCNLPRAFQLYMKLNF